VSTCTWNRFKREMRLVQIYLHRPFAAHGIRLQETSNPRSIQSSKRDCPVLQVVQGLSEQLRDTVKKREHACVALVAIPQFRRNCEYSGVEAASREVMTLEKSSVIYHFALAKTGYERRMHFSASTNGGEQHRACRAP
jgi:hypothetical protein